MKELQMRKVLLKLAKFLVLGLSLASFYPSFGGAGARAFAQGSPVLTPRPVIYQLVVRHFGNKNSTNMTNGTLEQNGSGRFSDVSAKALREIRSLGVTHIWLTGVLQQATLTDYSALGEPSDDPDIVKGRAGSFFAVKDYFDVCPDYADNPANRLAEFKELVQRIHAAGMKVMMDLVPNHVARSYFSNQRPDLNPGLLDDQSQDFKLENNFVYVPTQQQAPLILPTDRTGWQTEGMDGRFWPESGGPGEFVKATGNRVVSTAPRPTDWFETIVLNYGYDFKRKRSLFKPGGSPGNSTWVFMEEIINYWAGDFGVDGFRVDFAHWVPPEAWSWIIGKAKERNPELFFVAEAYEDQRKLLDSGFDAVYDDETYDVLKGVQNNQTSFATLRARFLNVDDANRSLLLRYLENHDERRLASPVEFGQTPDESGFGSMEEIRLFGPLHYLAGGGPLLIYNGQTEGETGEGREGFDQENGRTSIFDYWQPRHLARWVNGGEFGFSQLSPQEVSIHEYYGSLLRYAQSPEVRSSRFYLLEAFAGIGQFSGSAKEQQRILNESILAYARYETRAGKLLVVIANFGKKDQRFQLRIPRELAISSAELSPTIRVFVDFSREGRDGRQEQSVISRDDLLASGLTVNVPARTSLVYAIDSTVRPGD